MVMIETEFIFSASTVIKHSRSFCVGVSQVQLSILCHYRVYLMPFAGLLVNISSPCGVKIMQPSVDLEPHLLLIFVLLPLLLHLSDLLSQFLEDLSSHLIQKILPHN